MAAHGITPAWAGKSLSLSGWSSGRQDHPRVGGKKHHAGILETAGMGSPPRRRGKVFLTDLVRVVVRITPAQAGKSRRCCLPGSPRMDHPRVGGEKSRAPGRSRCGAGSPPHGRGKVYLRYSPATGSGITPAWAGKRSYGCGTEQCGRDHPRTGGEKRCLPAAGKAALWITPAWAGKSAGRWSAQSD